MRRNERTARLYRSILRAFVAIAPSAMADERTALTTDELQALLADEVHLAGHALSRFHTVMRPDGTRTTRWVSFDGRNSGADSGVYEIRDGRVCGSWTTIGQGRVVCGEWYRLRPNKYEFTVEGELRGFFYIMNWRD